MPFRIDVTSNPVQMPGVIREQEAYSRSLRPLCISDSPPNGKRVAVCGGGPSLARRVEEVWQFDEVWGINGTADWLLERGIDAWFLSVDPQASLSKLVGRAKKALLGMCVHRDVWEKFDIKNVLAFEIPDSVGEEKRDCVPGSVTTATFAPGLAARMGFKSVHFFGCDSSFEDSTHAYRNEDPLAQVWIKAGKDYRTSLQFMVQAEQLSGLIKEFPGFLFNHSDGLLSGMLEHDDWEVTHYNDYLKQHMKLAA